MLDLIYIFLAGETDEKIHKITIKGVCGTGSDIINCCFYVGNID